MQFKFNSELCCCCFALASLAEQARSPLRAMNYFVPSGYRSNPQGVLLQAEWLGAELDMGVIGPDSTWSQGTSSTNSVKRCPR